MKFIVVLVLAFAALAFADYPHCAWNNWFPHQVGFFPV